MLNISLLGCLRMDNDGVPLKLPSSAKLVSLFAYLLLNPVPIARETLGRTLWPDMDDAASRARLRRHLYLLRRVLPPHYPSTPWLIVRADNVQWNPKSEYRLDTARFVQAANDTYRLTEALLLYEGELLAEVGEDWLSAPRTLLHELYLAALRELTGQLRQEHKYDTALIYAHRLRRAAPLEENAVRLLMTIRYAMGDRAAAIAEYQEFAQYLAAELGVAPMPETTALYEAIASEVRLYTATQGAQGGAARTQRTPRRVHSTLPFVGREDELGQLKSLWEQSTLGQGSVALIGGEAGIGKTRLCTELSAQVAAEGGRVLYGETTSPERHPYQALITALRRAITLLPAGVVSSTSLAALLPLLPELSQLHPQLRPLPRIGQARERDRIYMSIRDCLCALIESRPLLLILEDLHWAGAATISLLEYLVPYFTPMPILLLITYREEVVGRGHPLRTMRQALRAQGSRQIVLTRLGLRAATQAIAHVSGLQVDVEQMRRLHRDSEGNPLFLSELVSNLWEAQNSQVAASPNTDTGLPPGIRHVVAERVGRLPPNTRLIAEIASVIGVAFSIELVREVSGLGEAQVLAAIDVMLDHALIREAGGLPNYDYTFTHHLIQESVYQGIEPGVRRRRHRRLALVLEDLYAAQLDTLTADLARHFDLGGEGERAASYYLNAAQAAASLYADDEALSAISRILTISPDLRLRWQALALAENIAQRQGEREAERSAIVQMEEIADALGDDDLACEVLRRRIRLASTLGERDEQAQLVNMLHHRARATGKLYWQAVALEEEAGLCLQLSQYQQTRERATAAISLYAATDNHRAQVTCYCLLVECLVHLGLFAEAQEILVVIGKLSTSDDRAMLVMVLTTASKAAVIQNNFAVAKQLGEHLLELCRAIQDREGEAAALSVIATSVASTTWAEEALDYFAAARRICAQLGKRSGEAGALSNAGIFAVHVGRYHEGRAMLEEASKMYHDLSNPRGQVVCRINIASSFIRQGDYPAAIVAAQQGLELAPVMNSPYLEANLLVSIGHAKLELGENEEAITYLESTLTRQREVALQREMPTTLSHLAAAYLNTGNLPLAQRYITEAIELYESHLQTTASGPDYPQYIYWVAARLAQQQGNNSRAADYLEQAAQLLERELASFAGEAARTAYHDISLNRSLLVALADREVPEDSNSPPNLPACSQCHQKSSVIRAGINPSGSQRYRCHRCKIYFTAQRKAHGYDNALRRKARELTNLGLSSREVARRLAVSHRSVLNWVQSTTPKSKN